MSTRRGNLDRPQKNWSAWAPVPGGAKSGRVASPAARFVQWKATLTGGSLELDSVDVAYLPKNLEPRIDEIEVTPPNYRFPPTSVPLLSIQQSLSLPPMGKRSNSGMSFSSGDSTPSMQHAKGSIGTRWAASDPHSDQVVFTVEIRGVDENEWKLLKDMVTERYLFWDSTFLSR